MLKTHRNFSSTALRLSLAALFLILGMSGAVGVVTAQTGSVTIDFETVPYQSSFQPPAYTGHQEDGFKIVPRVTSGSLVVEISRASDAPLSGKSVTQKYDVVPSPHKGELIITRLDNSPFEFSSVDLFSYGKNNNSTSVNIKGYSGGESGTLLGEDSFPLNNRSPFTGRASNLAGKAVDTLVIEMIAYYFNPQGYGSAVVDNIVLMPPPPPPLDCTLNAWTVSTHDEFKQAIACFNAKTAAATYTITLGGNIALLGATPAINNANPGVELVLDGAGFSMDGGGALGTRPIEVRANTTVTIRDLTVQNAVMNQNGGAIRNFGTLTIEASVFSNNSTDANFGGAIANENNAILTVEGSLITGNKADRGAGISADGTVLIRNSTISNNGGRISSQAVSRSGICTYGGGIYYETGIVVENSTIVNNACENGGGVGSIFGLSRPNIVIRNSTIAFNQADYGGGINQYATLKNTIVINNSAPRGPDQYGGIVVSEGYNMVGVPSSMTPQSTDIIGVQALLSPLGNYGGATPTVALLPGSPAINAGDPNCPATDQRGVARVGGCDIGAFESRGFTLSASSGSGQTANVNASFANPLVVSVSSAFNEPVDGGRVDLTAPAGGASLATTAYPLTISGGSVSQPVTANGVVGSYTVNADTPRGNLGGPAAFSLTNIPVAYAPVAGFGNALDFDGNDEFVEVPYAAALNPDSFTVEGWAYPRNNSRFQAVFSSRDVSTAGQLRGWTVYVAPSGKWEFWATGGTAWNVIQGPDVQLNQWTHLAVSYSGGTATLYIDGVLAASKSGVNLVKNDARPFRIGAADDGTGTNYHTSWFFDGQIDEVRVWDGALTQAQIAEYRTRTIQNPNTEPGLAAYWAFNQSSDSSLIDLAQGHNGTLQRMENGDWQQSTIPLTVTTSENVPVSAFLKASDDDRDPMTFAITQQPANGTLSGVDTNTGAFTYTPNTGYCGDDTFQFQVNDGGKDSNIATQPILILCDAPVRFTVENPGVQTAQIVCPAPVLEDFDSIALGAQTALNRTIGVYSGAMVISDQGAFGGAAVPNNSVRRYISASNNDAYTLTLANPAGYFGFWWSAIHSTDQISVTLTDGRTATLSAQTLLAAPALVGQSGTAGGFYGNPTVQFTGQNAGQPYVFVNVYAPDVNGKISAITFSSPASVRFNSDNHTACADVIGRVEQSGTGIGDADFGDAPDTYATSKTASGAVHSLYRELRLGGLSDNEASGFASTGTDGDDLNNLDDEDTLTAPLPAITAVDTGYALNNIPVYNNSGGPAILAGWIDFNRNGTFDASEGISTTVPSSAVTQTVNLSWSGLSGLVAGQSYVRLRLSDQTSVAPTGPGGDGELEDYALEIGRVASLTVAKKAIGGSGTFTFTSTTLTPSPFNLIDSSEFLATGANFSCAIDTVGAITCWGDNSQGALNAPSGQFNQISSYPQSYHACALKVDGSVDCWGYNNTGQAVDQAGPFTQVSVGGNHTCALKTDGSLECWGANSQGQSDAKTGPYVQVTAALGFNCALKTDGEAECWGDNSLGQLNAQPGPYTQLSAGRGFACGLKTDGSVTCWGSNNHNKATPPAGTFTQISAGAEHACGLKTDNSVACWGQNIYGQAAAQTGPFTEVSASLFHTCAVQAAGGVSCWGKSDPSTVVPAGLAAKSTPSQRFTNLAPGTYDVSEVVPAGWNLTDLQCTGGNPTYTATGASVTLAGGDDVTCTFENTQLGTVVIEKRTAPAGGVDFGFTITDTLGVAATFALSDTERYTDIVVPGAYTVTEDTVAGGRLTELRCDDTASASPSTTDLATRTAVVNVEPGETVTCSYVNTEDNYIAVIKQTNAPPRFTGSPDIFNFSLSGAASASFILTDFWSTGDTYFRELTTTGVYTITETSPTDYDITDIECAVFPAGGIGAPTQVLGDLQTGSVAVDLAQPGQAALCVFTNTALGSITIEKEAYPADNTTFDFSSPSLSPSSFALTPSTATPVPSQVFTSIAPGSYTVGETTPSGWILDDIDCQPANNTSIFNVRLADGAVDIDLAPGEDVTCTFVNRRPADLTVVKNTVGGDGTFDFSTTTLFPGTAALTGTFSLTTTGGTAQRTFTDLLPGFYDVVEAVPQGWSQSGATCDNGDTPDNVFLNVGESVTCTITNTRQSSITLVKNTIGGGGGVFTFTSQSLTPSPVNLIAGQTGTFSGPLVSRAMDSGAIHTCALREDGSVACWGSNYAGQAVDQTGPYIQVSSGDFGTCALTPDGAVECWGDNTNGQLASRPDPYTQVSTGGRHTCAVYASNGSVECWGDNTDGKLLAPAGAFAQISAGQNFTCGVTTAGAVTCWGNNSQGQTNAPSGTFTQVSAGQEHACALRADGTVACWGANASGQGTGISGVFTQVSAGFSHNCALTPDGAIKCWGASSQGQSVDLPGPYTAISTGAAFTCALTPAGAVQCWGLNPSRATPPSANIGQPWQRVFADLPAGTYDISETVPQDWKLTSATCASSLNNNIDPANITLAGGEDVTCTFENTKQARLTVIKSTNPPGGSGFDFTINGGMTTTLGTQQPASFVLDPGAYQVTELVPAGWQLTNIFCNAVSSSWSAGADNAQITLAAGDDIRCFFTNIKLPTLTIVKSAQPADGTDFDFEITGAASNTFKLDDAATDDNDGVSDVISYTLPVGSYVLTETTTADWNITLGCRSATGSNGLSGLAYGTNGGVKTGTGFIDLAVGDDITCTYRNTKSATLTVEKKTVGGDDTFQVTRSLFSLPLETYDLTTQSGTAVTTTTVSELGFAQELEEIAPQGWMLTDATCTGVTNNAWQRNGDKLEFTPSAGDNITCTFTNTRSGKITVVKSAAPADDTRFTVAVGDPTPKLTNYYVQDPSSPGFSVTGLPGAYQILEGLQAGWDFPTTSCQSTLQTSTFTYTRFGVNIDLAAGDDVFCSLRNEKKGSLTVVKNTVGGDAAFTFSSAALGAGDFPITTINGTAQRRFDNLSPRTYDLSEVIPAGWQQGAVYCSDGSTPPNVTVDPGEDVTCTFANSKLDTIIIEKRTVGGDGAFTFSSNLPNAGSFNLKTVKGVTQRSFTNLTPGTYNFAEVVPAGWTATVADPLCSNGDNASSVTLTAGETVVCTFVNLKQDTIVVEKRTIGGDGVFEFTSPQLGGFPITTTNGTASQSFDNQAPGTYSITETVPAGWALLDANCDNGDDPTSVTLAPGETVRCTFDNVKLGSITVVKNSVGGDDTFNFTGDLGAFPVTTVGGSGQHVVVDLMPGTYAITETVLAGWDATNATCSDNSNPAAIDLAPGENVTCIFDNTKLGSLTVQKRTVGGDSSFTFDSQALGSFVMTTTNGAATPQIFPNLVPGSYDLAEVIPSGWRQTRATCSDGSQLPNVDVAAGEDVTCTFENAQESTIVVAKFALGGNDVFTYTSKALGTFVLTPTNNAAQRAFSGLTAGSYDITEVAAPGWVAADPNPVCSNGDRARKLFLAEGETVYCLFTNVKQNSIIIEKRTTGGDGAFDFTGDLGNLQLTTSGGYTRTVVSGLNPGTYSIAETVPAGWTQSAATCDNNDAPGNVTLALGEVVTCTFENTKLGKIEVLKRSVGGNGDFVFNSPQLGTFDLKTAGTAKRDFFDLAAGTYAITETVPAGWDLTSATCTDGSSPAAVNLSAGEEVTCFFTNTKRATLTVIKQSSGGDGNFNFSFNGGVGNFSIPTSNGAGQKVFANLRPGTYNLSETAATGWDLDSAICSDGSNPATLTLDPGENVTCTFRNTKRAALTIIKQAVGGDDTFNFTSAGLGNFSLPTVAGTGTKQIANIVPGTYAITETAQAGWQRTGASCTGGADPANLNLTPGIDVTCTFTNIATGSITVVKDAVGGDDTFNFTSTALGNFSVSTSGGAGQYVAAALLPGTYDLAESLPTGWSADGATCSDGSTLPNVTLDAGEDVTCTFRNVKQDTIVVVKRTVGGDGVFSFSSPQLQGFDLSTNKGRAVRSFSGLQPGSYSISETVPAGWNAASADPQCSNGQPASSLTLNAGETVICEFVNLKQDTLIVEKKTIGGDGSFSFNGDLGSFSLSTSNGAGSRSFTGLAAGTYAINETVPAGWTQTSATCDNGSSPSSVTLGSGETVTCTFTNTRLGSITVVKQATGGDAQFNFSSTALGNFPITTTGGVGQQRFANLAVGTYDLSEDALTGWTIDGASCSDGSAPSSVDVAAGEDVICTFGNTKQSSITVVKQTSGGDGTFSFVSAALQNFNLTTNGGTAQRVFGGLAAGTYAINETVPAGWALSAASCSDGSDPAGINLAAGKDITCTFENTLLDTIIVQVRTLGGDTTFKVTSPQLGDNDLSTSGGAAQQVFDNLAATRYDINGVAPAGWALTNPDPTCSNGDPASAISLVAGETVTCEFVIEELDTLIVEKTTVGGDGVFAFTSPQLSNFSLTTSQGISRTTFSNLTPGTFAISETVPAGWALTSASCTDGSRVGNIDLTAGETLTCRFVNTRLATLTIVQRTRGSDGVFNFSSPVLGSFVLKTSGGIAQQTFDNLLPGVYGVNEVPSQRWSVVSASCDNGQSPDNLTLNAGDNVTCVFENVELGSLIVVKRTLGGDGIFAFNSTLPGGAGFKLNTIGSSAQQTFTSLTPGSYAITETVAAGWDLTSVVCSDGSNPANVNVGPGEDVTCTFENTKRGRITLVKNTVGGDGAFAFTGDLGGFSLITSGSTAQKTVSNLVPGVYGVNETAVTGWDMTGATCSDGSNPNSINLGAGENVTCTFTNTKRGSLTVVKNAGGGDDSFAFTSGALGSFVLTTTGGTAQRTFANLVVGSYDLAESVPSGWQLTGATCSDGSDPANVNIAAGEDVTCTFENLKNDTIVVIKRAIGGDDRFVFTSTLPSGNFSLNTTQGQAQQVFNVQPGNYSISETVPAGWTAQEADPVCSNGQRASALSLTAGQSITCEFVNLKNDTIVVEKKSIGGDGSFAFTGDLGSFSLGTSKGSASRAFTNVQPGTYSISETVPAGWVQTAATCDNGQSPDSLNLVPGATVTCTFTNTKQSAITVIKRTVGGDSTFDFGGDLGSFSLKTAGGLAKDSFTGLAAGTYAITETVPAGWDPTSATCSDGSSPAAIDLAAGEQVTCTFVNAKLGSLTVVKDATGGDDTFDFNSNTLTPSSFSLTTANGAAQQTFANLVPGVYDVREATLAGWRQDGVTCSDGSSADSIDIGPGEDVTCTFANTKLDTITIVKLAIGGDDTFGFSSNTLTSSTFNLTTVGGAATQSFTDLPAGIYDVTENTPSGWVLDSAACSDGSDPSAIDLAAGESVICLFVNRKPNTIVVEKRTLGGDGTFAFSGDLGNFSLTTGSGVTRTVFSGLQPGTFSISETVPVGWDLTSVSCDNGDDPGNVTLLAGNTVTCRFENTNRGSLTVVKNAIGGDDSFVFTGDLGGFTLTTSSGSAQQSFADLLPGTYAITETATAGWDMTSATCDNGSSLSAVSIAAGEDVTCTFENTKRGSLTVVKQTTGGDSSFAFTSQALGTFSLSTRGGAAQRVFANLGAGIYDLAESVPVGWDLTSALCSDGSNPAAVALTAGEDVTCTFRNVKRAGLTIVKRTVGGDGSFAFISGALGNFNLATAGGTAQRAFTNLLPGTYAITETVPSGWQLTGVACSDGSNLATLTLTPGVNVTCTFTNTKLSSLTVVKETTGGDGSFAFSSGALGTFSLATTKGTAQRSFTGLTPGSYDLSETLPAGWRQESATCSDGSNPAAVALAAGEDVTCTFRNLKLDTITVIKRTVGGDGRFAFTSPQLGGFGLTTTGGSATRHFSDLTPGSYTITEAVPAGWTAQEADPLCSNGDRASNLTLAAGETVVCEFVNQKQDTLIIETVTVGGDASFTFSSPQLGSFSLTTSGGRASRSFTNLSAGSYAINESVPAGWALTSAVCDNNATPGNLTLTAGETVTCTFTNTKLSSLTVVKQAAGGDAAFAFSSAALGNFTLTTTGGTAQQRFTGLAAGTYDLSETVPAGWDLTNATCTDGSSPAAIDLAAGEEVTCTFVNAKRGSLTVVKDAIGGDDSFDFNSSTLTPSSFSLTTANGTAQQTFADLVPGVYDVSEVALTGWRQDGVTCSDGSSAGSIDIGPGEDVTCIFANTKLDTITVVKRTVGGDDSFDFSGDLGNFSLTTSGGTAQQSFDNLNPGVYSIRESLPGGWTPQNADPICSNGDRASRVSLAAGESVVCEFVNLKNDTVIVEKRTVGGDGTFSFSGDLGSFDLTTSNGVTSTSFSGLQPGTFSISETVPAGWDLTSATCDNGSNPANLVLGNGETVTCAFVNTKRGSLTVVKNTSGGDGVFAFGGDLGGFNLTSVGGTAQRVFADLVPGAYAINETVPAGWDLTSATCSDGSNPANVNVAPGEHVVCTFANTKWGELTVAKQTVGGDGAFNIVSAALGNFRLTTVGGTAQRAFASLVPGVYDLNEAVPAGWDLTSATCSDGSNPASVNVGPGERVTCTFENTKRGRITVVKNTTGGDATFDFSGDLGNFSLTTAGNTAQRSFSNLVPGVYGVNETALAGWDATSAVCSDGSTLNSINLGAGEDVTCTFTNTKRGSLTVVKNATGGDDSFAFTSGALGNFSLSTAGGTGQQRFTNLVPGSYDLSESVPSGWQLTGATCSDGSDPANVDIAAGEDVTCTFENLKNDTIVVVKRAIGGDETFTFSSGALGNFSLSTLNGTARRAFANLSPGSYTISETVPAGWTVQEADPVCSNGQRASALSLTAGQSITCEFVNLKNDTIVVEKKSIGGDGSFAFTGDLGSFSLGTSNGSASRAFTNVQPGTYSISETVPTGWVQTAATCDNGQSPDSLNLVPGATVTCTFTNTKQSAITVIKRTVGGDSTFDFGGDLGSFSLKTAGGLAKDSFTGLAAGTYAITETVPAGWDLTSATCSDGSDPSAVNLAAGEEVTCTFVNTKRGSLTVVKDATGGDDTFDFNSNTLTPSSFSLTTVVGTAQQTFADLVPGVYDISEATLAGWRQDGVTCSDGSSAGSIDIGPGENVTCTFANTKLDTITVVKRTVGGDGSFDFSGDLGNFSLTTSGGTAQQSFDNLNPGVYSIRESLPGGWTPQNADPICSNGDNASRVSLAAGESVVCEFVNLKNDTVILEKRTVGGDGTFSFSGDLGSFDLTTSNGVTSTSFSGLQPGTFSISETVPAGWDLTSATCDNGSNPANLVLGNGETVTCTFVNTKRGSLTVVKNAVGGNDSFVFTGDLGDFMLTTTSGTAQQTFADLRPGTYAISETVPAGWDMMSASCDNGSSLAAVSIAAGEDVTCTVENTKRGSLTVVKNATGGDGRFNFSSGALGSFVLTTTIGVAQQTFADLVPGVYDVNETVPAGWALTNATCDNGDAPSSINLGAGDSVTCTFENTRRPAALYLPLILKQAPPQPTTLYLPLIVKALPGPLTVYRNTFTQGVGSEWTAGAGTSVAPNGEQFLGELGKITTTLSLTGLPAHSQVTVAFDLYIMRSWDGNQESVPDGIALSEVLEAAAIDGRVGPDLWRFKQGEQMLLETTFANIEGFRQSYPDAVGVGDHPRQTGAVAVNTLGYTWVGDPMDATYRIERTFAHTAGTLDLHFKGVGLQALDDESWGIDNITVIVE